MGLQPSEKENNESANVIRSPFIREAEGVSARTRGGSERVPVVGVARSGGNRWWEKSKSCTRVGIDESPRCVRV